MIDVNAYLGHYAFRQLRHNTAPELLALMDRAGIDKAMVSSASAITYRNAQSGNDEVAAEVKGKTDRLIPFAVINPAYAGWEDDLATCHEAYGMRGLRLYPLWHNYRLTDPRCLELVSAATERNMIVSIPIRVEDARQRSWLVDVPELPLDEVAALCKARPKARFLLVNGLQFTSSVLGRKDNGLPANYRIEISRMEVPQSDETGPLIEALGADRVVFGTGMPFSYPEPALLKLDLLDTDRQTKDKVAWRNAAEWLGQH